MKRAFLEKINGEWLDDFVYVSRYPLQRMDYEVVAFDGDDMDRTLFDKFEISKNDIIIGSVQVTVKFFNRLGVPIPTYLGYPDSLKNYLGRDIQRCTIEEINTPYPFFIKPAKDVKLFTGSVVESKASLDILLLYCGDDITKDTEVYLSDTIEIVSEYRCFVREGQLKGIQYYAGDFQHYINSSVVKQMIKDYENPPNCYTLDVAFTVSGHTVLIEVNDMWAIGAYGFDANEYALMCARRMNKLLNNN
jgi:hypothetical protein